MGQLEEITIQLTTWEAAAIIYALQKLGCDKCPYYLPCRNGIDTEKFKPYLLCDAVSEKITNVWQKSVGKNTDG